VLIGKITTEGFSETTFFHVNVSGKKKKKIRLEGLDLSFFVLVAEWVL